MTALEGPAGSRLRELHFLPLDMLRVVWEPLRDAVGRGYYPELRSLGPYGDQLPGALPEVLRERSRRLL